MFKPAQYTGQAMVLSPPAKPPSSEASRVASSLVHILKVDDLRYDIRAYGGQFIEGLPRRVGSSSAFDSSVAALVACYNSLQHGKSHVDALAKYGTALKALRKSLSDESQPLTEKIYSIYLIYVCQEWIDRRPQGVNEHRTMLAKLVQEAAESGTLHLIPPEFIYGLCQLIVWESMTNHQLEIGDWFFDALDASAQDARPYKARPGAYITLDIRSHGELAVYIRDPRRHHYQLQCMYALLKREKPQIALALAHFTKLSMLPGATTTTKRICLAHQHAYALILDVGAVLNAVLRALEDSFCLEIESRHICDEAIRLAEQCRALRPFGSALILEVLKSIWATTVDRYRCDEVDKLLREFSSDFRWCNDLTEQQWFRCQMDEMTAFHRRARGAPPMVPSQTTGGLDYPASQLASKGSCVIL
ncbi:hypothetical protein B0I35DRAFT_443909 [Stachybotrys elegans]|uniref:Uncharacterized protein n=1 Tax=Stachybotrys elegans TaxID=80388 RepID=A0A8K0SJ61_9HYPO|nr:hypothetical protein B0I35DRAFT_443909 [Stachybotrys elegans]